MGALTDFFANFKAGDPNKSAAANEIAREKHRKAVEAKRKAKRAEKKKRQEMLLKLYHGDTQEKPEYTKSSKDGPTYDPLALADDPTYADFSGGLNKGLGGSSYNTRQQDRTQNTNALMNKIKF